MIVGTFLDRVLFHTGEFLVLGIYRLDNMCGCSSFFSWVGHLICAICFTNRTVDVETTRVVHAQPQVGRPRSYLRGAEGTGATEGQAMMERMVWVEEGSQTGMDGQQNNLSHIPHPISHHHFRLIPHQMSIPMHTQNVSIPVQTMALSQNVYQPHFSHDVSMPMQTLSPNVYQPMRLRQYPTVSSPPHPRLRRPNAGPLTPPRQVVDPMLLQLAQPRPLVTKHTATLAVLQSVCITVHGVSANVQ
jgi:hypothetical protein